MRKYVIAVENEIYDDLTDSVFTNEYFILCGDKNELDYQLCNMSELYDSLYVYELIDGTIRYRLSFYTCGAHYVLCEDDSEYVFTGERMNFI